MPRSMADPSKWPSSPRNEYLDEYAGNHADMRVLVSVYHLSLSSVTYIVQPPCGIDVATINFSPLGSMTYSPPIPRMRACGGICGCWDGGNLKLVLRAVS